MCVCVCVCVCVCALEAQGGNGSCGVLAVGEAAEAEEEGTLAWAARCDAFSKVRS